MKTSVVSQRVTSHARSRRGHRESTKPQALFGFGKDEAKEREREEAFEAQQQRLRERRSGEAMRRAKERRQEMRELIKQEKAAREKAWEEGKNVELPRREGAKSQAQRYKEQQADGPGIVIPMAPFGVPEYDNGERFDLKAPYVDKGWVDEEADLGRQLGKLFGWGKKGKGKDEGEK